MKKILKTALLYLFVACFAGTVFTQASAVPVEAAQKVTAKMNYSSLILIKGKAFNLKATFKGTTRKPTWKSSNTSVATVNSSGRVVAKNYGTTKITAKVGNVTASCNVNVVVNYKYLYKQFLASNSRNIKWFYMLNINKKGVPELVTTGNAGAVTTYTVYTIKGTKVVKMGTYGAKGISSVKPCLYYVSKYKCLYASGWTNGIGGSWGNLYSTAGYKLAHRYHAREAHYPRTVYYAGTTDTNCRQVSKSYYTRFCNSHFKGYTTYYMKKNTASQRNSAFR